MGYWVEYGLIMLPIIAILLLVDWMGVVPPQLNDDTHPPLSEEEYLALFEWDVDPEIALEVRKLIADIACVEESRIRPQNRPQGPGAAGGFSGSANRLVASSCRGFLVRCFLPICLNQSPTSRFPP